MKKSEEIRRSSVDRKRSQKCSNVSRGRKRNTSLSKIPGAGTGHSTNNSDRTLYDPESDFLCDRTVEFVDSGDLRNVVSVELADQSMYFERLLRYHQNNGVIILPEFLNSDFSNIIEFIRTGNTIIMESNVYNLFIAADFLLISKLKTECIRYIKQMINNPRIAIKVWINCRKMYSPELEEIVFDKILENFEEVCKIEEFKQLEYVDIHTILSNDNLNCSQERIVMEAVLNWYNNDPATRSKHVENLAMCIRIGLLSDMDLARFKKSSFALTSSTVSAILESWPMCLSDPSSTLLAANTLQLSTARSPNQVMMVFGGWCDGEGPRATAQVYDPNANQWTLWSSQSPKNNLLGEIPRRVYAGCVLVDKRVYLVGGFDGDNALKSTLCYNFELDSGWYEISCMYEKRYYVSVAYAKDFIYALGGHNGENQGRLDTAERYNIAQNLWMTISPMNRVRSDAAAAALDGHVYISGGFDGRQYHASSEFYNAETNQWTLISPMISPRGGVTLASHNGFLYAIGGNDGTSRLKTIERYNPGLLRWEIVGSMTRRKSNLSCTVVNDDVYIIGGWSDEHETGILDLVEKFNTRSHICEVVESLCFPASATCACTLTDRSLVIKYIQRKLNENALYPSSSLQYTQSSLADFPCHIQGVVPPPLINNPSFGGEPSDSLSNMLNNEFETVPQVQIAQGNLSNASSSHNIIREIVTRAMKHNGFDKSNSSTR